MWAPAPPLACGRPLNASWPRSSDQSPAVLARLAQVQAERTLASLRRCVQRGLIPEAEAVDLAVELGLIEANPAPVQPSADPTRP